MDTDYGHIDISLIQLLNATQAWHYQVVPVSRHDDQIELLCADANEASTHQDELEMILELPVRWQVTSPQDIEHLLLKYYRKDGGTATPGSASGVRITDDLDLGGFIREAKSLGSSDLHFEPYEHHCRIRYRIDGVMIEKYRIEKDQYPSLVNKLKIESNLDIAEKRLPQDGRIQYRDDVDQFDIRVSTLPTLHGEKVVLRLLRSNVGKIDIRSLGFQEDELKHYLAGIHRSNGIVLISGPTGSGKTTTLYASLSLLNDNKRNILTIEDPIEYTLEGINQVQLKENIGLGFASTLRTFLRQDPDIIMVGEIRDVETAQMAIRASLTGHLVLSTIHTNSAWGIISRLVDMGVPAYLLADTLNTVAAQRLVRVLCDDCKTEKPIDRSAYPFDLPKNISTSWESVGCANCYSSGYKGRIAIYEIISIDEILAQSIRTNQTNIKDELHQRGVDTLGDNALRLLKSGVTSLEEVYPLLMDQGAG